MRDTCRHRRRASRTRRGPSTDASPAYPLMEPAHSDERARPGAIDAVRRLNDHHGDRLRGQVRRRHRPGPRSRDVHDRPDRRTRRCGGRWRRGSGATARQHRCERQHHDRNKASTRQPREGASRRDRASAHHRPSRPPCSDPSSCSTCARRAPVAEYAKRCDTTRGDRRA